jgi:methionyl-tRNA formyltransferase
MKIGYFADGPWSHLALERIARDRRFEVAFIVPRFDTQDPVLREWAGRLGVPFLPFDNVNSPAALATLARFGSELFVSMSFNQIVKREFLAMPPRGVINCHAGALPFYRGRNILNWALINDEREFAVTVHYVDEGIDTGDLILQQREPITDADTYRTLLDRAIAACADVLHRALLAIADGTATRTPQSAKHPVGLYVGRRREGDEWIDWSWSSRRIFNFVRAISAPGPGARTIVDDAVVVVERAALIAAAPAYIAVPGEIVGAGARGVTVKTGDSTILLEEVTAQSRPRLSIGKRFVPAPDPAQQALARRVVDLESRLARVEQQMEAANRE